MKPDHRGFSAIHIHRSTRIYRGRHFSFLTEDLSNEVIHLFIARGLTFTQARPDPVEIIRTQVYPLKQLMDMVAAGAITDALTVLALQRVWFQLHGFSESRKPI